MPQKSSTSSSGDDLLERANAACASTADLRTWLHENARAARDGFEARRAARVRVWGPDRWQRERPVASAATRELVSEAVAAALYAFEQAFAAPSVYGLPSEAAVAAYARVLREREPEAAIRARLEAALRGGAGDKQLGRQH